MRCGPIMLYFGLSCVRPVYFLHNWSSSLWTAEAVLSKLLFSSDAVNVNRPLNISFPAPFSSEVHES